MNREQVRAASQVIESLKKLESEFFTNTNWTYDDILAGKAGAAILEAWDLDLLTSLRGLEQPVENFRNRDCQYVINQKSHNPNAHTESRFSPDGTDLFFKDLFYTVVGYRKCDDDTTVRAGSFTMQQEQFPQELCFVDTEDFVQQARPLWSCACGLFAVLGRLQLAGLVRAKHPNRENFLSKADDGYIARKDLHSNTKNGRNLLSVSNARITQRIKAGQLPKPIASPSGQQFKISEVNEAQRSHGRRPLPDYVK